MLLIGGGKVSHGYVELAAVALVELALLVRIGSVPESGLFARKNVRRLIVRDEHPTGALILNCALERLAARGKPWHVYSCVKKLAMPVSGLVVETRIHQGTLRREGRGLKAKFMVADEQKHRATVYRLDTAWPHPDDVTDPRDGAFVDLLRNAADRFSRGAQHEAVIRWEWYPQGIRDTVEQLRGCSWRLVRSFAV